MPSTENLDFSNIENAFVNKSKGELRKAYWLFKAINSNTLVSISPFLIETAFTLRLPVKPIIRATIYKQFCGGESIEECRTTIDLLHSRNIGSILDYSVEGTEDEKDFEHITEEILRCIEEATDNPKIPFSVFKVTGIASNELLEKKGRGDSLSDTERDSWNKVVERVDKLCKAAYDANIRIFLDAEETWTQKPIDDLCREMMIKYNKEGAVVYTTIQLYLKEKLEFLKNCLEDAKANKYILGVKLVRGAYMEKERERAENMGYPSPVQDDKEGTDRDFDEAVKFCMENIGDIAFCSGTHNEKSCYQLAQMIAERNLAIDHKHIYFSQLLGMSDHISYNLSTAGYNVAKYVPYGPVKSVMPYLLRRAQENTSISGQMSKELKLIISELKRR